MSVTLHSFRGDRAPLAAWSLPLQLAKDSSGQFVYLLD
jgi:hypothetical protein